MRVSLLALCSLTACVIHEGSNTALAHAQPEPESVNETTTLFASDGVLEEVPSMVPPEHLEQPLFSDVTDWDTQSNINSFAETDHVQVIERTGETGGTAEIETAAAIETAAEIETAAAIETAAEAENIQEIEIIAISESPTICENRHQVPTHLPQILSPSTAPEMAIDPSEAIDEPSTVEHCVSVSEGEIIRESAIAQNIAPPESFVESLNGSFVAHGTPEDIILAPAESYPAESYPAESYPAEIGETEINITNGTNNQPEIDAHDASPLERPPTRLLNLETANHLEAGALQLSAGGHQTSPNDVPGTGNQIYYGDIAWGVRDDLQVALTGQVFDDPPRDAIDGRSENITFLTLAASAKYQLLDEDNASLSVLGSAEVMSLSSLLLDTDGSEERIIGSLQLPFTYNASPDIQLHLTPGLNVLPNLYGTTFNLGAGVSWQPSDRWMLFSTLNVPVGPGDNTIDSDDGSRDRRLVWSAGTRYNVSPKVGLNLYATNGFGVTPATSGLTFIPDGEDTLLGLQLQYTPDAGSTYRQSFRDTPDIDLSERDQQLLIDGFTLTTANTLQPGSVALSTGGGSNGNYSVGVAYSPDQNFQIEGILEDFGSDDSVSEADSAGEELKYMLGGRVRFLDQVQGDPFSLGARLLAGRDFDEDRTTGRLFLDVPLTYQVNDQAALFFNPRLSAFADEILVGVGLGVNYEVARGLQLIGEVTPVIRGDQTVWAAGGRYQIPETTVSLDLYATNGIGRNGLGTLVGDPDGARAGFNVSWILGDR